MIIISLCNARDDDNTCDVANDYDPDNEVENTAVNNSDESSNEQFKCLVEDDGNKEDDNCISNKEDDKEEKVFIGDEMPC